MKIDINIDDYLSEEEKKDLAKKYFLNYLDKGLKDRHSHKANYDNYERIVSNSVYEFLDRRVDSMLNESHEEMIKSNVEKNTWRKRLL